MSKLSPLHLTPQATRALRVLASAYGILAVLIAVDALSIVQVDPQQFRPESVLVGDLGLTPDKVYVGAALCIVGLAFTLGLMLWLSETAVEVGIGPRMRAVMRWFPVLLALLCCIPFLLDDLHNLSTLVITITP
jgi:hypothetical protein